MIKLNNTSFQKLQGCRKQLFESLDKPALKPLPVQPYTYAKWKIAGVNLQTSEENTTRFEDESDDHDIYMITDFDGGLLISPRGYKYPLWIDETSRAAIDYSSQKALVLKAFYIEEVPE